MLVGVWAFEVGDSHAYTANVNVKPYETNEL